MNQNLPLPKYHQIYLVLCEKLQEGKFDSGLPGELALMQQYSVARVTVRRALSQMAEEGLIKREPGRGTRPLHQKGFEKPGKLSQVSNPEGQQARLTGLLENLVTMGLRTSVKVISVQHLKAPKDVGDKLQLKVEGGQFSALDGLVVTVLQLGTDACTASKTPEMMFNSVVVDVPIILQGADDYQYPAQDAIGCFKKL
jgi:DNA-binding GntR family transcriptional regulator